MTLALQVPVSLIPFYFGYVFFYLLLTVALADKQYVFRIYHNKFFEALQHYQLFVGCFDHTFCGVYHHYILAQHGIAEIIFVTIVVSRFPCAKVAPAEVRRDDENVLCLSMIP